MKLLATLTDEQILEAPAELTPDFELREAARAVLLNDRNEIALINVTRDGFYKLPGGGIEAGESHEQALQRECREEIGDDIEILCEIGQVEELRGFRNQKQISYCYVAKATGEHRAPQLSEKEIFLGQVFEWIPRDQALKLIENGTTEKTIGKYIIVRDAIILREGLKLID